MPFPDVAQWGPILALQVDSETGQLWLGGNFAGFRADLGRSMNLMPLSYRWENGKWLEEPVNSSFSKTSELRKLKQLKVKNEPWILGVQNSGAPIWLR